eukprot:CAMPEP_0183712026 /NCGR_PEP_ID=MMETSP0737-20130205/7308_1 /TAXON_ID=385413 /ORGANISM="Thalassiosira miniscula, Strain CCMP1093" /LENGTH=609 /DNA_ID=CAMNT_0025940601 /DNA_START=374 /DNA_END=2203 /DNA_ORIENTATION=+
MTSHKRVFPVPYQVDFTAESKGRHLDSTKRKLTWKFGFAHPPSVFPHLFDANENYIGETNDGAPNNSSIAPHNNPAPESANLKQGTECRGREHEIILTWSILTGKVHIYVDSREIYRHEPVGKEDSIFSTFSGSFHRGFDLPSPKFNGHHRIDIRCYARTPMGAKNMAVDDRGGKFRQYDLTVDGLSYFSMPAVYELGTERMWNKVSRWGLQRSESGMQEESDYGHGGGMHGERHRHEGGGSPSGGSAYYGGGTHVDEMRRNKYKKKNSSSRYGKSISKSEYKEMNPRTESEEERMIRLATEASLQEWEKDVGYGQQGSGGGGGGGGERSYSNSSSSSYENQRAHSAGNGHQSGGRVHSSSRKQNGAPSNLGAIGEDNLIDFGALDGATAAISQISISKHTSSDVSVLDDDATTASFMMNTAWNSSNGVPQQQPPPPPAYGNGMPSPYQQPSPGYGRDPTFAGGYAQQQHQQQHQPQQPWNGSMSSAPGGLPPSDASFAVAPAPTLDDYKDAFGKSMYMGASVASSMNPMSPASMGMASPMAQQQQQQQPQYGMQLAPAPQYSTNQMVVHPSQSFSSSASWAMPPPAAAPPAAAPVNKFDPLRSDPFAS